MLQDPLFRCDPTKPVEAGLMVYALIVLGMLACALLAVHARRLMVSALWLAGASALASLLIYLLGAPEVAVIELSVGAGLVTVLFVFAINIAGEESAAVRPLVHRPLAWGLVALALLLLGWLTWPRVLISPAPQTASFVQTFWRDRFLDVLLQIALIFSGVLGILGLLTDGEHKGAA